VSSQYEDVIVDVGGRDTTAQRSALLAADLALFPFAVGSLDAWTLPQVERMLSDVRQANAALGAAAFISRGFVQGPDNSEAAAMLQASSVLRYLDTPLIERRAYLRSSGEGLAVSEFRKPHDPKANAEIQRLYDAVFNPAAA
jgi:chromosome partitioning protein